MSEGKLWFKAKTHGWGWGLPISWQGWVAYVGYFVVLAVNAYKFPPARNVVMFLAGTLGATVLLLLICLAKGEKPSWRWGDR